ncbi:hypothetical protein EGW08_019318 [Elysia chlorotica]|uniref:Testis-expressed sequence 264 protein n=1 Tax=Elysia chlorotica TaxID=188477 RepID=A0A3S1B075_ELYCH|nr:hypothetical protein EGW08_019318 [Elysia chlorotica]
MVEFTTFSLLLILITVLVILLLATIITVLIYSGLLQGIEDVGTGKPPVEQLIIAYKFQQGPYHEAGQIFTEAAIIAPENKAIGIYYDDPKKVSPLFLRYAVGSIIAEGKAAVDENMVKQFTERGFKILHLPEVSYAVQTRFPHVTTLSILIGIRKAYPRLEEYIEEHKLCAHPCMEYYDGKYIHFFAPLSKQDEFYVPECTREGASGDADRTQSDAGSFSGSEALHDTEASLNVTQDSVETNTTLDQNESMLESQRDPRIDDDGKVEEVDLKGSETASEKENKGNEKDDDDDVSDDSSSSFEVVKKEKDI